MTQLRGLGYVALGCCMLVLGCQATVDVDPAGTWRQRNPAIFDYIADQRLVAAEPAYRAMYTVAKGEVFEGDFEALTAELEELRVVDRSWNLPPDRAIDRAALGYMVMRATKLPGGINWTVTGLGRYAWRELVIMGIAPDKGEFGLVSGSEFNAVLAKAEDEAARRNRPVAPRPALGPDPN